MRTHSFAFIAALGASFTAFLAVGCADYRFTINDRVVYTPPPLFSDYVLEDDALAACVKQHIHDSGAQAAGDLLELNCSHAGITSLAGLDQFSKITRLKLSSNQIEDLAPLAAMTDLRQVILDNNDLDSIMALRGLDALEVLNLQGNRRLPCQELQPFASTSGLSLVLPEHCANTH